MPTVCVCMCVCNRILKTNVCAPPRIHVGHAVRCVCPRHLSGGAPQQVVSLPGCDGARLLVSGPRRRHSHKRTSAWSARSQCTWSEETPFPPSKERRVLRRSRKSSRWGCLCVLYLYVKTRSSDYSSNIFIAQFHRELVGHVLKVVQERT